MGGERKANDCENENRVVLESVFQFSSYMDLFSYVYEQKKAGKTVYFDNEDFAVSPEDGAEKSVILTAYGVLIETPKIATDYMNWLVKKYEREKQRDAFCGKGGENGMSVF